MILDGIDLSISESLLSADAFIANTSIYKTCTALVTLDNDMSSISSIIVYTTSVDNGNFDENLYSSIPSMK